MDSVETFLPPNLKTDLDGFGTASHFVASLELAEGTVRLRQAVGCTAVSQVKGSDMTDQPPPQEWAATIEAAVFVPNRCVRGSSEPATRRRSA